MICNTFSGSSGTLTLKTIAEDAEVGILMVWASKQIPLPNVETRLTHKREDVGPDQEDKVIAWAKNLDQSGLETLANTFETGLQKVWDGLSEKEKSLMRLHNTLTDIIKTF